MAKAARGSTTARAELFERHWRDAWRRARTLMDDDARAEDVVQDAFEKAFRGLGTFRGDAAFGTWLGRIVTNAALDALRRTAHEAPLDDEYAADADWPEDAVGDAVLRRTVRALDPDRRAVVALVYWGDLTLNEAADALGIPVGTAKSRLARALDELRHHLGVNDVR